MRSLPILLALAAALGCGSSSSGTLTGGPADAGGGDATQDASDEGGSSDPLNAAPTCTSGKTWTLGDRGSSLMHPGGACMTCHAKNPNAPLFSIAGTVFPSGHEPDDCNGANGATLGLQVVITDAKSKVTTLGVNSVGNFYSFDPSQGGPAIAFPIHAKVVENGGKERAMTAAQSNGDCNSCHTQNGANSAPGRIAAPE
jgi:hypothetical protein